MKVLSVVGKVIMSIVSEKEKETLKKIDQDVATKVSAKTGIDDAEVAKIKDSATSSKAGYFLNQKYGLDKVQFEGGDSSDNTKSKTETTDTTDSNKPAAEQGTPTNPSAASLYPQKGTYPTPAYSNRTSVNAVATGKNKDTVVQIKDSTKSTSTNFEQPQSLPSVYPNNHVWATKRHIIEMDDTGAGKINIQHGSGSHIEIFPDGHIVIKSTKGDCFILSNGKLNVQAMSDCNVDVRGNANVSVDGNLDAQVKGHGNVVVKSDVNISSHGKIDMIAAGRVTIGSQEGMFLCAPQIFQQANAIHHEGPETCEPMALVDRKIADTSGDESAYGEHDDYTNEIQYAGEGFAIPYGSIRDALQEK